MEVRIDDYNLRPQDLPEACAAAVKREEWRIAFDGEDGQGSIRRRSVHDELGNPLGEITSARRRRRGKRVKVDEIVLVLIEEGLVGREVRGGGAGTHENMGATARR